MTILKKNSLREQGFGKADALILLSIILIFITNPASAEFNIQTTTVIMVKLAFVLSLFINLNATVSRAQANDFALSGYMRGCKNCKISLRGSLSNHNIKASNTEIISPEGSFVFTGQVFDPTEVRLVINDTLATNPFFLESGNQKIALDIESLSDPVLSTNSKSNNEYQTTYTKQIDPFHARIDSYYSYLDSLENQYNKQVPLVLKDSIGQAIKIITNQRDSAFLVYVQKYPKSMVALWKLYYRVYVNGYNKVYDDTYGFLDKTSATSYTGVKLKNLLDAGRRTRVGATFPRFKVLDLHKASVSIFKKGKNTYTLIDFWFSGCLPCKRQFNDLKEIFYNFEPKGFSIQGVSIDKKENELIWKQTIGEHQLPWPQVWDVGGKVASALSINTYPTNFLVDKDGNIIARDMEPHELRRFLETSL